MSKLDDIYEQMAPAIIVGVDGKQSVVVMFLAPQSAIDEMTLPQMAEQYAEFMGDVMLQLMKSSSLPYKHLEKVMHKRVEHLELTGKVEEVFVNDAVKNYRKMN